MHSKGSCRGFRRVGLAPNGYSMIGTPLVRRSPLYVRYHIGRVMSLKSRSVFVTSMMGVHTSSHRLGQRAKGLRLTRTGPLMCMRKKCCGLKRGVKGFN